MSQKDKYLNSAQKFIQKGQLERAIKDYEQVVAADPKDVRHRQKLAELFARCNRNDDACREYETIARYYEENGFYLKSIAVYKQLQKLKSGTIEISVTLAALNEKLGLVGNALSEYKVAFDYYEKEGLSGEALKILEKMRTVDPENADIVLKIAESQLAAGKRDNAYKEYVAAANMLKTGGNQAGFERVCSRINSLFPEKESLSTDLLDALIETGEAGDIVPALKQLLAKDERNLKLLTLYAQACKTNGDMEGRKYGWERILHYFPSEVSAKEGLLECVVEEGDLEGSLGLLDLYSPDLISAGMFDSLEKFYTAMQSHAPYDTRLLHGLKTMYEASGDVAKLADVQVSLNILSSDSSEEKSLLDVIEQNGESESRDGDKDQKNEISWDDGIDLSITSDVTADSLFTESRNDELDLSIEAVTEDSEPVEEGVGVEPYTLSLEELSSETVLTDDLESGQSLNREEMIEDSFLEGEEERFALEEEQEDGQDDSLLSLDLDESLFEIEFEDQDETLDAEVENNIDEEVLSEELVLDAVENEFDQDAPGESVLTLDESDEFERDVLTLDSAVGPLTNDDENTEESSFEDLEHEVERQLDRDDTETHFNLGIAYKEMDLYDEAINEFRVASSDPLRAVDCLILQGICLVEKGELAHAEELFESGISQFERDPEKALNLKYELALLYENTGRSDEALRTFRDVFSQNPSFRDTAKKIANLHGSSELPDFSDIDDFDFELKAIK